MNDVYNWIIANVSAAHYQVDSNSSCRDDHLVDDIIVQTDNI